MRWLYHVARVDDVRWSVDDDDGEHYRASSLDREGFVHASYRDLVVESAQLYFASDPPENLRVLAIDPRRLDVSVDVATTPRGPMPHIHGPIPRDACIRVLTLDEMSAQPDRVTGTRIALCAFEGMTLLDLVGPLDALSRIESMGFDSTSSCEVISLTKAPWTGSAATFTANRYRPRLDAFDVLVIAGGPTTRSLEADKDLIEYLKSYPSNRLLASVCTGALLIGAMGRLRGKRATTHASALDRLASFGAVVVANERVVDEGNILTSAGVTAGIDLGLHLIKRLESDEAARAIAKRMEYALALI